MMIPPVNVGTTHGLRQYEKPPQVEDGAKVDRETGSRRVETVVYTAETPGAFNIPSLSYPWFDAGDHAWRSVTLSAVKVTVAAAAATHQAITPELQDDQSRPLLGTSARLFIACAVVIVLLGIFFRPAHRMARKVADWVAEINARRFRSDRSPARAVAQDDPDRQPCSDLCRTAGMVQNARAPDAGGLAFLGELTRTLPAGLYPRGRAVSGKDGGRYRQKTACQPCRNTRFAQHAPDGACPAGPQSRLIRTAESTKVRASGVHCSLRYVANAGIYSNVLPFPPTGAEAAPFDIRRL